MLPLLKSNRLLIVAMIFLFAAAIAVPLLMKQMPWQLRFVVSFTDFVAGTSIAMLLRQRSKSSGYKAESPENNRGS
jgi:hypothetical protein